MARRPAALAALAFALPALAALSALPAQGGDDDAPPFGPAPAPKVARDAEDPLDALVDRLTCADPDVRRAAEAELSAASPDTLRTIVHRLQRRLLSSGRGDAAPRGSVAVDQEARWALATPEDVRAILGVASKGADPAIVAATSEIETRWGAAAKSGAIEVVSAPRLTTYDGQQGTVQVLDQRSYVQDYDVQTSGGSSIADPIVETVQSGSTLGLTARVSQDRSRISVAIDADLRRLVEPMAEERLEIAKGLTPLVVQRPEVVGARWQRTISVRPGGAAFVVFPAGFYAPEGRRLVLEYRASVIDLPTPAPAPDEKPVLPPPAPKPTR